MNTPPIAIALVASAAAAFLVAAQAMPPMKDGPESANTIELVGAEGGRSYREGDGSRNGRQEPRRQLRGSTEDCHRDVRTHRINGEWVTHRHVGDACQIRVVNRVTQPPTGD